MQVFDAMDAKGNHRFILRLDGGSYDGTEMLGASLIKVADDHVILESKLDLPLDVEYEMAIDVPTQGARMRVAEDGTPLADVEIEKNIDVGTVKVVSKKLAEKYVGRRMPFKVYRYKLEIQPW